MMPLKMARIEALLFMFVFSSEINAFCNVSERETIIKKLTITPILFVRRKAVKNINSVKNI